MEPYGGLTIPIENTESVKLTCNMDAIDFLLDLKSNDDHFNYIKSIYNSIGTHVSILKCKVYLNEYPHFHTIYVLIITNPPACLKWFKGQKYIIVASRLMHYMKAYFVAQKAKSLKDEQFNVINYVLSVIDIYQKEYRSFGTY